ncbi:metallophosphoesterase [Neisseria sp. Ec49-e6-T10]|uniref:metallophosphoesterase n=1 Tax=Neisseria sp. Ec49-e6-T10 TaxID=3140744 RepID=UPI003EBC1AF0
MHHLNTNELFYYGSFLAIPYFLWLCYRLKNQPNIINLLLFTLGTLFIWSRFIEPQLLLTKHTTIANTHIKADILLVADLHIGAYKSTHYLERLVNKINATPAQFNIIAGDFIYAANPDNLNQLLAPLAKLNRPTYIVLGNHDTHTPKLNSVLTKFNLINIEQKIIDMPTYQLAGVGDRWNLGDDPQFLEQSSDQPILMVAHNPDSAVMFDPKKVTLVLAGHTHCGQIRIPFIYEKVIPSEYGFNCLLETTKTDKGIMKVFITRGIGEIGLPMRLFNPPTIDVLHLAP